MAIVNYQRNINELRQLASMFWPPELSQKEAEISVMPKLLETQEQFISILSISVSSLNALFKVIDASSLSANLFVKHLVVLADFGGEMLQRLNNQFTSLFPSNQLNYVWNEHRHYYRFKILPILGSLNNSKIGIDGKKLVQKQSLSDLHKDIIAILLFASNSTNDKTADILNKCEIGNYIGKPEELNKFIKQRYLFVSRITSGSQSNTLGQIAQNFVKEYLETKLNIPDIKIKRDSNLPKIYHTEETERPTSFDIVVNHNNKYVAIEVSFQVTTNSVIERKSGQAKSRFEEIEKAGHKIAYVIDGAGNFQRQTAVSTICFYSHCTVAFSRSELDVLCNFLIEYFEL